MTSDIRIQSGSDTLLFEHLRLLVDGVLNYAIYMLDEDGNVVTWSGGAERIKGFTAEEVIGKHFSLFYPEAEQRAGKPERNLRTALEEGSCEDEGWRVRKDGTRFWANVLMTPLRAADGTLRGFAKVTRDITDRKLAEEALHQSEERFRLLVESVRDYAIYLISPEGRIISWNAGATRIKGYIQEEALGRHFSMFYPPEDIQSDKPGLELEVALAEGRYEEEGWRVRKDGSRFWANVVITPVRDRAGTLVGFAKITRDLTDRRRAREELLSTRQQARELSLENEAKEEFLGIIGHELRSPLAVLYGSSRYLEQHFDELSAEDAKDLVKDLADAAGRYSSLVENLLALARPGSAGVPLQEANLHEAVVSSVAAFERRVPLRVINLDIREDSFCVKIDPAYFDRVIQNLLENADKYSEKEHGIDVHVCREGSKATIEVMDRGPGVDALELEKIFDSFYRSPRTAASRSGKGLGLSVCRRLLKQMGGSIEARPRPDGGLILRVILPVCG